MVVVVVVAPRFMRREVRFHKGGRGRMEQVHGSEDQWFEVHRSVLLGRSG